MVAGLVAAANLLALVAGMVLVRRRAAPRLQTRYPLVDAESPLTVIDRVERSVSGVDGYASERTEREIVIYRKHEGPLGFFDDPKAPLAEATMDLLHVRAERKDGATEVQVKGRSEARVLNRVKRALDGAR